MNTTLVMLPEGMIRDKQRSGVLGKALGFLRHFCSVLRLTLRPIDLIKLYRMTMDFIEHKA